MFKVFLNLLFSPILQLCKQWYFRESFHFLCLFYLNSIKNLGYAYGVWMMKSEASHLLMNMWMWDGIVVDTQGIIKVAWDAGQFWMVNTVFGL